MIQEYATIANAVNHELLLDDMENCFGVCDSAKTWMSSYLFGKQWKLVFMGKSQLDFAFFSPWKRCKLTYLCYLLFQYSFIIIFY